MRFFNTTGPCNPTEHYMLPPAERLQGAHLHRYVPHRLYWMLHAPRQTGKTTFLQSWLRELNTMPDIAACYVSVEACQAFSDAARAMPIACRAVRAAAAEASLPVPAMPDSEPEVSLGDILRHWAQLVAPRALVVLFDETDVLKDTALITFLRLLRGGFATRAPGVFPTSIALVGIRDLKDYTITSKDGVCVNPGSPFNIKQDSAVIGNFSRDEIARLFAQRTAETGQQITPEALDCAWEQSRGQPWLVNSLFMRATTRVLDETSTETVTPAHILAAREQEILAREPHLDALAHRMEDPCMRRVMESLITGEPNQQLATGKGFQLCLELGLVIIDHGTPKIANPIYCEVLTRQITHDAQLAIPEPTFRWQTPDGTPDMDVILREFQNLWREYSEVWEKTSDCTEAFPHLLLMAFLQRILNGKGRIEREYAAGRGRLDLLVEYAGKTSIIEIKLIYDYETPAAVRAEGLEQIVRYRDHAAPGAPAHLIIFDRRSADKKLPWNRRIKRTHKGGVIILGC